MASGRRQYPFHLIEPKWQQFWDEQQTFRAFNPGEVLPDGHPFARRHHLSGRVTATQLPPKFYILDMFPYPSGAGLHVGHPEGYTATDILARYKRAQGFHVLHPMGWDAFGLPAEQYAIKTGQHPRQTTEANIATFKRQIQSLGFSYDWSREIATTGPDYFKWTQWIFLKLYNSWFNPETNKAEPIETLKHPAELQSRAGVSPAQLETKRRAFRDSKRLAYVSEQPVWWCEQLGTVLANEEVVDGKSEVGGFPVVRKPMRQWMLRITAYAEKLLADLNTIDWSDSLKEMQRNWIGRSEGAEVDFQIAGSSEKIRVFTTRPDTLFGATYMVVSPEHKLVEKIIPNEWPAGTPYYWKGQLYHGDNKIVGPDRNVVRPIEEVTTVENRWFGLNAPVSKLTFAQAEQKAKELGIDLISLASQKVESFEDTFPRWAVSKFRAIPVEMTANSITIATDCPEDFQSLDSLNLFLSGKEVQIKIVTTEDFEAARHNLLFAAHQFFQASPRQSVEDYRKYAAGKSDLERTELAKEKTGVFTGAFAINPVNGQKIPIWIADYVLASYGTGAIMAVPAHDTRDFEFANKFNLPIVQVVQPPDPKTDWHGFIDDGISVNSTGPDVSITGLPTPEAKKKITAWLEANRLGRKTINYKLRDWLFSRQRYWGEPLPIVWKRDASGNLYHEALPESALPVLPPALTDYKPTATGEPPLARAKDWVNLPDGSQRETNTMPQWAGSCWYYLRYLDAKNAQSFVSKEAEQYWMSSRPVVRDQSAPSSSADKNAPTDVGGYGTQGVDLYVGGTEHAVLHLLYARFWHKVLFDLGCVSTPEPFFKLVNQGLILGEDGQKMSKARGNVVNPDDIVSDYGADSLRLFEMFMGPLEMVKPWNTKGVEGVYRFLGRVWRLFVDEPSETEFEQAETLTTKTQRREELLKIIQLNSAIKNVPATPAQLKTLHACIKKVTEDLDGMRFNTAISAMMVFVNDAITWETKPVSVLREFLILLAPFAPHLAEELWAKLNIQHPPSSDFGATGPTSLAAPERSEGGNIQHPISLTYAVWPKFDPALLVEDTLEIPVQVNGKLRDVIKVPANADNAKVEAAAKASEKVQQFIAGKTIRKVIVVPKKLVNIVVA